MAHDGDQREAVASTRTANRWQGTVLAGTYRVLERLGRGGMGEVFEAEHLRVGKKVAVKFMNGDAVGDLRALERFRREVRALSAITSEHVVGVLDCGELDGEAPYIVMDRLHGEDLRHLLAREGPLSVYRALRFALDACAGLCAVHGAGLIHRDLKPANLFVTRSKALGEHCKILDFGVAKGQASEATLQGSLLGTVRYMAPEQLSNSASVAAPTDVYAVGAILFECLTNRPAHDADSPEELMFGILNRDAPPVTDFRPALSRELADVIACAMSRRPSDRFQSVAELAGALEELLPAKDSDETAQDLSQTVRPLPRIRRARGTASARGAVAVALVAGIAAGFTFSKLSEPRTSRVESPSNVPVAENRASEYRAAQSTVVVHDVKPASTATAVAGTAIAPEIPADVVPSPKNPATPRAVSRRPTKPSAGAAVEAGAKSPTPPATVPSPAKAPTHQAAVVLDVKNPYEE